MPSCEKEPMWSIRFLIWESWFILKSCLVWTNILMFYVFCVWPMQKKQPNCKELLCYNSRYNDKCTNDVFFIYILYWSCKLLFILIEKIVANYLCYFIFFVVGRIVIKVKVDTPNAKKFKNGTFTYWKNCE